MTMSGGTAGSIVPKLVDDPEAVPAVEPWPVREKVCMCHRALLAPGSLTTLLLLPCFVLGRGSASSAAWLKIDLAKLTGMNNGTAG
jgi:xyloglucan fucosyltransferase